jgi:hypothetical protein
MSEIEDSKNEGFTKLDESQHLSEAQRNAVPLLLEGKSLGTVGKAVGRSRQTISEWVNHDPEFKAELRRGREEISDRARDGLLTLRLSLVDTYAALLEDEDPKVRLAAVKHMSELWLRLEAMDAAATAAQEARLEAGLDRRVRLAIALGFSPGDRRIAGVMERAALEIAGIPRPKPVAKEREQQRPPQPAPEPEKTPAPELTDAERSAQLAREREEDMDRRRTGPFAV